MKHLIAGFVMLITVTTGSFADTIGKYAGIAKSIPEMALKADANSQAWARSARSVLAVTDETVGQTISVMNSLAKKAGQPIICPPESFQLNADAVHQLLQEKIAKLKPSEHSQIISEVVVLGFQEKYPCKTTSTLGFMRRDYKMQSVRRLES